MKIFVDANVIIDYLVDSSVTATGIDSIFFPCLCGFSGDLHTAAGGGRNFDGISQSFALTGLGNLLAVVFCLVVAACSRIDDEQMLHVISSFFCCCR